jgi:hypothetical protein
LGLAQEMVAVRLVGSAHELNNVTASWQTRRKMQIQFTRGGVKSFRMKLAVALEIPRRRMIGVTQGVVQSQEAHILCGLLLPPRPSSSVHNTHFAYSARAPYSPISTRTDPSCDPSARSSPLRLRRLGWRILKPVAIREWTPAVF